MLKQNNSGLVQVNSELASVSQTLANDRVTFGQAMHELSIALGLVQKFVQANRSALTSNVTKLDTVAKTLATERDSLLKALSSAPLLVQNFINAYDPKHNLIRGRGDLNELTVWADNAAAGSVTSSSSVTGGPPTLLPPANASGGRS
jgi:ABC-type transporter Mla subunit MlaD